MAAPSGLNAWQAAAAKEMHEDELRANIKELADTFGWSMYWTHRSDRSPAGFPDLVLAHPNGRILFVELKREKTKPRPSQVTWLDTLTQAGKPSSGVVKVDVWRPRHYFDQTIRRELQQTRPQESAA